MLELTQFPNRAEIQRIEAARNSRVILLAATSLDLDILPALYETLTDVGQAERLDVLLFSRGGQVNAVRRLALLLHDYAGRLSFLVPHYCESAATILSLAGHEVVAGPLAIFTPIDPQLGGGASADSGAPASLSAQDIRLFAQMAEAWFGMDKAEANAQALALMTENIFPPTLTAFYRACDEVRDLAGELLTLGMPGMTADKRSAAVERLMFGYHSHGHALSGADLAALGLPVSRMPALEEALWRLGSDIRASLGAGVCASLEDGWYDMMVGSRAGIKARFRLPDMPKMPWHDVRF